MAEHHDNDYADEPGECVGCENLSKALADIQDKLSVYDHATDQRCDEFDKGQEAIDELKELRAKIRPLATRKLAGQPVDHYCEIRTLAERLEQIGEIVREKR